MNLILNRKKLKSLLENERFPIEKKIRLIDKVVSTLFTNDEICDIKSKFDFNSDGIVISVYVKDEIFNQMKLRDDLVDDIWEKIYNLTGLSTGISIRKC